MIIYIDENLSEHVADALNSLNKGYFTDVAVESTKNTFGRGKPDEEIIPLIGKNKGVLITQDFNIKKTQLQFELCKQHKLGIFFITLPKNEKTHWDIVQSLIGNWPEIVQKTRKENKPFAFRIRKRGKMEKL